MTSLVRTQSPWTARATFADILGDSPALRDAKALAQRAAQAGCPVLLLGETGTGKELFAQAIHNASARTEGPFVPIDCAAIPRDLLEAELFGYVSGAFSGATREGRRGKFALAQGGTVFLDEIGDMPVEMQAKLLRVLQEHQIVPLGSETPVAVDFTVIAATNRDVNAMAQAGTFRRDLLYRLDVLRVAIPPLRTRDGDVPSLVEHFIGAHRTAGRATRFSRAAMARLCAYPWPGNVRELAHLVEQLCIVHPIDMIEVADLPPVFEQAGDLQHGPTPWHLPSAIATLERTTIRLALEQAAGNRADAAKLLGISQASLYRKLAG